MKLGVASTGWFLALAILIGIPAPVAAQQYKDWEVEIAPFYFWAPAISGSMTAGPNTVPVELTFSEAADKLEGAFAFHFEGRKGRIGVESDLYFVRLSTNATYQLVNGRIPVSGTLQLDNNIFEVGGTYLVAKDFTIIGGVRTYSMSPSITLTGPNQTTSFDVTRTNVDGFGGFMFRPPLGRKFQLLSRADIGGGASTLTWRATLGVEYRYKTWGGVAVAYSALGIDAGDNTATSIGSTPVVTRYNATQYGPAVSLTFRWGR
jgi:hypothetical protein